MLMLILMLKHINMLRRAVAGVYPIAAQPGTINIDVSLRTTILWLCLPALQTDSPPPPPPLPAPGSVLVCASMLLWLHYAYRTSVVGHGAMADWCAVALL